MYIIYISDVHVCEYLSLPRGVEMHSCCDEVLHIQCHIVRAGRGPTHTCTYCERVPGNKGGEYLDY